MRLRRWIEWCADVALVACIDGLGLGVADCQARCWGTCHFMTREALS